MNKQYSSTNTSASGSYFRLHGAASSVAGEGKELENPRDSPAEVPAAVFTTPTPIRCLHPLLGCLSDSALLFFPLLTEAVEILYRAS